MPRSLDPEKRQTFLRTALHLFVTQGVQNTSTAEIARQAGAAAGTLFLYFPTKDDLINTLLMEIVQAQSAAVKSHLTPGMPAQEQFRVIWDTTIAWFLSHPEAYQYVLQVRDSGWIADDVVRESALLFDYYYTAIQHGLQTRAIKPFPPDLVGDILYHHLVAVTNTLLRQPSPDPQADLSAMGFDIFWSGIKI